MPRVIIVGAGISGLATAHRLESIARQKNNPIDIDLFEASPRLGGTICTHQRDGFLWEEGPDSFITEKPWALDLCRTLGLENELIGTNRQFQKSYVVYQKKLHPTPMGFYLFAPSQWTSFLKSPLFSWSGKCRAGLEWFLPRRSDQHADESLASFVRRRFGQEMLVRMAQPMVGGVYSADPEKLSLRSTFPKFLDWEWDYGSVIRGMFQRKKTGRGMGAGTSGARYSLFMTLRGGMSRLLDALERSFSSTKIHLNKSVQSLNREGDQWTVRMESGESVQSDGIVLALPTYRTAGLVSSLDQKLAGFLDRTPYGSASTLHLAFSANAFPQSLDGFGFVVPVTEGLSMAGCTFSHNKFEGRAPKDHMLLRVFLPGNVHLSEKDLVQKVQRELAQLLGVKEKPLWTAWKPYEKAMPQYPVGHLDDVKMIEEKVDKMPGLALAGNGLRGLGIPDCVRAGTSAADLVWGKLGL